MTNGALLKQIAEERHLSLQELAEALGITRQGLHKKITNATEFKASEVEKLSQLLKLTYQQRQAIFFAV